MSCLLVAPTMHTLSVNFGMPAAKSRNGLLIEILMPIDYR